MRIAIYNEPMSRGVIGGAEYCALVLADALRQHNVEIVHHDLQLSKGKLASSFAADLGQTAFRYVPRDNDWLQSRQKLLGGDRARRRWRAEVSADRDWLITICHGMPPFCHAQRGILYILFPAFSWRESWPRVATTWPGSPVKRIVRLARSLYHDRQWKQRLASYCRIATISEYSRRWCQEWWGIDAEIIYPPVDTTCDDAPKAHRIAAVGRFEDVKRQTDLVSAFAQLCARGLGDWRFTCYGNPTDESYYRLVQAAAAGQPVDLVVGASRSELKRGLAESPIFWHAMGYGCDERANPERLEHFGISTVEAMAAGAVPVVINKGGQREIVEHGVSGFLWNTLDELEAYTLRLIRDPQLQRTMGLAARQRAALFSKQRFADQFAQIVAGIPSARCQPPHAKLDVGMALSGMRPGFGPNRE